MSVESITPFPAKLIFSSEDAKRQIVEHPDNPFHKLFLVDVEARAAEVYAAEQ
jgi:hypothetical protein